MKHEAQNKRLTITTLSKMNHISKHKDSQQNGTKPFIILNVIYVGHDVLLTLSVIVLNVVRLNGVRLNVMVPFIVLFLRLRE